jgi:hypothetical protein
MRFEIGQPAEKRDRRSVDRGGFFLIFGLPGDTWLRLAVWLIVGLATWRSKMAQWRGSDSGPVRMNGSVGISNQKRPRRIDLNFLMPLGKFGGRQALGSVVDFTQLEIGIIESGRGKTSREVKMYIAMNHFKVIQGGTQSLRGSLPNRGRNKSPGTWKLCATTMIR